MKINGKDWMKIGFYTATGYAAGRMLVGAIEETAEYAVSMYWGSQYKKSAEKGDTKRMAEIRRTCAKQNIRLDGAVDYDPKNKVAKGRKIGFEI